MTSKSTRPACAETNPVFPDPGTSARDRAPIPWSTGLSFSAPPDWTWSHILQRCYPAPTQNKISRLASNLSFLEHVHNEPRNASLGGGVRSPQRLRDADSRTAYSEHMGNHSQSVSAMASLRETVKSLTPDELELPVDQFNALRVFLYHKINDLAPYYTQMGNLNLLAGQGHWAWMRTCNVTSLSMAIEGLGVGPSDFKGDIHTLEQIAAVLEPWRVDWEQAEQNRITKLNAKIAAKHKGKHKARLHPSVAANADWGVCESSLADLRMPDFVQYVTVYVAFTNPPGHGKKRGEPGRLSPPADFHHDVLAARNLASSLILFSATLIQIAESFGVHGTPGNIESYGKVRGDLKALRDEEKDFVAKQLEKYQKDTKQKLVPGSPEEKKELDAIHAQPAFQKMTAMEKADTAQMAALKKTWSADVLAYRQAVLAKLVPSVDKGAQIVVNRPGHYMKLHGFEPEGPLMDNPWVEGQRVLVPWNEAYEQGYFRTYIVFTK